MSRFSVLPTYAQKTLRYLKKNGVSRTLKKISRRISGKSWLPQDEDALLALRPFVVPDEQIWHMPGKLVPYRGKVSVVIPAYNGAHELPGLLDALKGQKGLGRLELVVVDSGSTDDTAVLAEQAGARVIHISQAEFSHSYARRLGAENASGEYLLFMTQDALPDGGDWLLRLMQPALLCGAAAVSCYERPRADADLFSRISAWTWRLLMCGGEDRLTKLPEDTGFASLRRCAQLMDNACLVRREIYMAMGGHRGDYAEDLELGIRMLRAGYRLGLLNSVSVIHSHSRPPVYYFKRAIVDAVNISSMFPDFTMDSPDLGNAASRTALAACANILYLRELSRGTETGEELTQHTREIYERNISALRRMKAEEIERLLFESGALNASVRPFMEELWQAGGQAYHFDPVLAVSQARYIMHYLCPYLVAESIGAEEKVKADIPLMLWQYFAQSAGYTAAACLLNAPDSEGKINAIAKKYQTGV